MKVLIGVLAVLLAAGDEQLDLDPLLRLGDDDAVGISEVLRLRASQNQPHIRILRPRLISERRSGARVDHRNIVALHIERVEALAKVGRGRRAADLPGAGVPAALAQDCVHLLDGRVPHAMLLEILSDAAFGTMIRAG